jgi:hypothetical protein
METGDFLGFPSLVLENQYLRLEVLSGGTRLVRLSYRGGSNLFAELPDSINTAYGDFHFLGGHRLWHSPEAMPRTYLPDIGEAQVEELPDGLRITRPPEAGSGIVKQIEVRLDAHKPFVTVCHVLRNDGLWPVECAPWALTVMRLGGVEILPQPGGLVPLERNPVGTKPTGQPIGNTDASGLLPNRTLVLWPYTRINDPRLHLQDDFITLRADPSLPPLKFGYFNPHGWIAYWLDGVLFVKRYDPHPGATFPDGGCNTETYCNDQFVELETLGPLGRLEPGKSFAHTETWEFYDSLDQPFILPILRERLEK